VGSTLFFGLMIGLLLLAGLFLLRDGIVQNAPGLAPLLPPKAAQARPAPAQQPNPGLTFDSELAGRVVAILLGVVHLLILVVMPLSLPPILSRCRTLSVGRWMIMAAVSGFFAFIILVFSGLVALADMQAHGRVGPLGMITATIGFYTYTPTFFGIPGCLIAAAVHPKELLSA
jgi:hypothetical protein